MQETGVDIADQKSTKLTETMLAEANYLITVCGHAHEHCPAVPPGTRKEHWPLDYPAKATGTEKEIMAWFCASRDDIRVWVADLLTGLKEADSDCVS